MAIIVKTNKPKALLSKINKAIDDNSIDTWSYDSDGDFTHIPEQWKNKAWLRPRVYTNELRFGILKQKDIKLTRYLYGIYHGRFIEMLLNHFDRDFSEAKASAMKKEPDIF